MEKFVNNTVDLSMDEKCFSTFRLYFENVSNLHQNRDIHKCFYMISSKTKMAWNAAETLSTFCLSPIKTEEEEISLKRITALH